MKIRRPLLMFWLIFIFWISMPGPFSSVFLELRATFSIQPPTNPPQTWDWHWIGIGAALAIWIGITVSAFFGKGVVGIANWGSHSDGHSNSTGFAGTAPIPSNTNPNTGDDWLVVGLGMNHNSCCLWPAFGLPLASWPSKPRL